MTNTQDTYNANLIYVDPNNLMDQSVVDSLVGKRVETEGMSMGVVTKAWIENNWVKITVKVWNTIEGE